MIYLNEEMNRRILVIDDNLFIHEDFREILRSHATSATNLLDELAGKVLGTGQALRERPMPCFELDTVSQGEEGLERVSLALLNRKPYAVAFVDGRMPPGWDGIETIRRIWLRDPDIQIVICTAYSDHSWEQIFDTFGHNDQLLVLKKPFDNIEVLQLATSLSEKWMLSRQAAMKVCELESLVEARTRDLQEREQQLRQSQKMEAVGRLAGGIAHDFNNLLTIQFGCSGILLDDPTITGAVRNRIQSISDATERAAVLTKQLLAFSRQQVLRPKTLTVNSVIESLRGMLERIIGEDIALEILLDPQVTRILADSSQLEQVIMNLVANSRDAMPNGGKLKIETKTIALEEEIIGEEKIEAGNYVLLSVADNGAGMPDSVKEKIFEPFFTTKEMGRGTGLGLSTVYGIVKQNKGHITFTSSPGAGAVFNIYFPVQNSAVEILSEAKASTTQPRGQETILLVEDEELVRKIAATILMGAGYKIVEMIDGAKALEWINADGKADMVLSDVVMPNMGGKELLQKLRTIKPDMPVILMSGYTQSGAGEQHTDLPQFEFIQKPFRPAHLLQKIREVLNN